LDVSPITSDLSIRSLVVQDYLNGISRDQTAKHRRISAGSVSNIIKNWKKEMQGSNVEDIRSFSKTVYKSGISVYQCARGYRVERILNNLGIYDDDDDFKQEKEVEEENERKEDIYNEKENGEINGNSIGYGIYSIRNPDNNNSKIANKNNDRNINSNNIKATKKKNIKKKRIQDFSFFVNEIYINCIKHGISPDIISYWIKDLMDIFNKADLCNYSADLNSNYTSYNDNKENEDIYSGCIQDNDISFIKDSRLDQQQQHSSFHHINHIKKAPFVSQISNFTAQSKKEYFELEDSKEKLKDEIKLLHLQKNQASEDLYQINQREKKVICYIDFFNRLKKELWEKYSIQLEEDIESFAKSINEFKKNEFDYSKILLEYITSISIIDKIKINQQQLNELEQRKKVLTESVYFLQNEVNVHSQIINTYSHLKEMGFSLQKLKQLYNIIIEIATENNISSENALSKFFADIEKEYDNNLGFESKVKEKKDELVLLNNQVNSNRAIFQLQPLIGPVMISLFQKGITEQDIIKVNQLVKKIKTEKEVEEEEINVKGNISDRSISNIPIKYKKPSPSLEAITDNLKKYKDINVKIKEEKKENYKRLKADVDKLYKQKKELSEQCQNTTLILNTIEGKLSFYKAFLDLLTKR
jgi:transposase